MKSVKVLAAFALTAVLAGSTADMVWARTFCYGREKDVSCSSEMYHVTECYEDGRCDVSGVCVYGLDCDGTIHHAQTKVGTSSTSSAQVTPITAQVQQAASSSTKMTVSAEQTAASSTAASRGRHHSGGSHHRLGSHH